MFTRRSTSIYLAAATILFGLASTSPAVQYDFLTVTGNNIPGNLASSTFTSQQGNGVINVTHSFSLGGAPPNDNNNALIIPSQFEALFPGTGQVDGHLAITNINSSSVITFDLTGYDLSASTVFGIWNMTNEASSIYRVELIDSNNDPQAPATFNLIGNQDNETDVAGQHELVMDYPTGDMLVGALINPLGTHTDAAFWDNIPTDTKKIIVYGNLPNLGTGDGVGYYFVEVVVPEPTTLAISVLGMFALGLLGIWRRR